MVAEFCNMKAYGQCNLNKGQVISVNQKCLNFLGLMAIFPRLLLKRERRSLGGKNIPEKRQKGVN